ncbi:PPOX class F420-dependent oxidoreductase [Glaciihabitans sp. INWT7]|uniref:PPOX class F420-dependent oxidoreductase n=1 Tax=Glaciihabitans sp. INWT7 TaxID=2596912 RepID=UPI0016273DC7|nr:PPOX class F420-dependent oxidoreductase [Glaciihabitans sp. INWT7]QNE45913.1 PPOX class F420-dependent oxidoreductase [Glaciihabitans sp. INWT7]
MTLPTDFTALGDEHFVSLTTFRKSGDAVSTPVWIARDGADLIVTTPAMSGKVKRLRNSPRVELRVCDRLGRVKDGVPVIRGSAAIESGDDVTARLDRIFAAKFKLEYKIFMFIESRGKQGTKDRVLLRITPA